MTLCMAVSGPVLAYRPFDGTDSDVVPAGKFELEFQPVGYLRTASEKKLIAPSAVLNFGIARGWEVVVEGRAETELYPSFPGTALSDVQVNVKHILRSGSLQGDSGPSVTAEASFLLPGSEASSAGAALSAIVSQRWASATIHANAKFERERDGRSTAFLGMIVEGPGDWTVQPVAEVFWQRTQDRRPLVSALAGAVWQPREGLKLDAAVRRGWIAGESETEVRLGLTVSF